ncbi:bifunctional adenosylcobinamide kinase/adenosylcobinamide-phosphate guanylyltransferase [Virgibacillus necropolis]|uniref:bifunctional adenosylcobinamide kinase/adenosylcobinamide-phosphate guanylyltransferase n=1 Tax=Virgibacillus necropolis TaxID=163877 RepID=UPI00384B204B
MLDKKHLNLHYVATGVVTDFEMQERVSRHKDDRRQSSRSWQTWELPTAIDQVLFTGNDATLLDCLTTWVTNEMMAQEGMLPDDMIRYLINQLENLIANVGEVYIVSNDLGRDIVSSNRLIQNYLYILGSIHRYVVRRSDVAIEMVFGVPVFHKGGKA